MSDLVSIAEVWRDRARVAEQAAADLEGLDTALRSVVARNYFGIECVEGTALYGRLREIVGGVSAEFERLVTASRTLAANSTAAAQAYEVQDQEACGDLPC
ncbi:hypothetical protein GCM10022231_27670 [Gordonia caeni]|uniref:ESX-1 secretion-associated protein n=1 Tax=Gordonia caeni TaxID=1007097 RepID=A0ABP7PGV6_9ACTN